MASVFFFVRNRSSHQHVTPFQGELTRIYERWRKELIVAMAHTEARIDFGEEQLEDESMGGSMSFSF